MKLLRTSVVLNNEDVLTFHGDFNTTIKSPYTLFIENNCDAHVITSWERILYTYNDMSVFDDNIIVVNEEYHYGDSISYHESGIVTISQNGIVLGTLSCNNFMHIKYDKSAIENE